MDPNHEDQDVQNKLVEEQENGSGEPVEKEAENQSLVKSTQDVAASNESRVEVKKRKRRPARVQKDPSTLSEEQRPPQTGTVFNIWYLKWSGGDQEDGQFGQRKSEGRCSIARDSGYTKADKVPGSYFCLYFARGLCTKGKKCEYLHRLPTVTDIFSPNVDCFGRDKFANYRDDMGGVGSFLRQNRTLYVGNVEVSDNMEQVVSRHFSEWGDIERIRVLNNRGIAFVTYVNEANAQFAKEAMAHQSLDGPEVLNVRWATQDPDPLSKARESRRLEEQAAEAIKKILPQEYVDELEGKEPKRRRLLDSEPHDRSFGLPGYEAPDEVWYSQGRIEGAKNDAVDNSADSPEDDHQDRTEQAHETEIEKPGLVSASALEQLKSLSSVAPSNSNMKPTQENSMSMLSGYGSDDD